MYTQIVLQLKKKENQYRRLLKRNIANETWSLVCWNDREYKMSEQTESLHSNWGQYL